MLDAAAGIDMFDLVKLLVELHHRLGLVVEGNQSLGNRLRNQVQQNSIRTQGIHMGIMVKRAKKKKWGTQ